MSEMKITKYL